MNFLFVQKLSDNEVFQNLCSRVDEFISNTLIKNRIYVVQNMFAEL